MSFWGRVRSLFLPQSRPLPPPSLYEGDPDQTRKERPLRATSTTRWYQSDIEAAILLADNGDLSCAGRLSASLRRDGILGGLLSTRTGGLTRLPKIFRGTPDALEALQTTDRPGLFDRIFDPKELALFAGDGIVLGVAVGELLRVPGRPEPVFVRLDPQFLRYHWGEDCWYYQSVAGLLPITPGDGRWILHMPGGYQQPWNGGMWPSLARAYVAKDHAFHYRENYCGKLANPARVAVSPAGASDTHKASFFQKVMAWGVNTVFGLPPGWDVRLIESNGRGYEVFEQTIASSNQEFMIGLAGQVVTTTGGAGFANADIHATIRGDLIQGDGDGLAATLNDQALRVIIGELLGSSARGSVAWDTRPPGDLNAEANAITAAANAIVAASNALKPYGLDVDASEMATRFKVPVVTLSAAPLNVAQEKAPADTPKTLGPRPSLALPERSAA